MEKKTYTIIEHTTNNADYFQEFYEELSQEDAMYEAFSAMKYACCNDFTTPTSCRKGTTVAYFNAYGYEVADDMDEYDFAELMDWEYAVFKKINGKQIAFAPNFEETHEHHSLTSDEARQYDAWSEITF